jgi:hypothetical protein
VVKLFPLRRPALFLNRHVSSGRVGFDGRHAADCTSAMLSPLNCTRHTIDVPRPVLSGGTIRSSG